MRLFVAIDFNKEKEYLSQLQEKIDISGAKQSFVKIFHLTLKFLGEVQPDVAELVKKEFQKIKLKQFSVSLDSLGVFPSENYIRVVWVGLKPEDNVLELQKMIDDNLGKLFRKENDFKAHVTLARVRFVKDKEDFNKKLKSIEVEKRGFDINEFLLVKSELKPAGPEYTTVARFSLTG